MRDELRDARVGRVEVRRIHRGEVERGVRHARLVLPARLEHVLVGIRAAHDLHDIEALRCAVGAERFETVQIDALAEAFPPRVAEPEERRAVGVLEVAGVVGDTQESAAMQRVVTRGGGCDEGSRGGRKIGIRWVVRDKPIAILACFRRREPHLPRPASAPERGHSPACVALLEDRVDLDIDKGARVGLRRLDRSLEDGPSSSRGYGARRRARRGEQPRSDGQEQWKRDVR